MNQAATSDEPRRAAACRAFWSDHALNVAYRREVADRPFSLREFVAFVMAMPPDQFTAKHGELLHNEHCTDRVGSDANSQLRHGSGEQEAAPAVV